MDDFAIRSMRFDTGGPDDAVVSRPDPGVGVLACLVLVVMVNCDLIYRRTAVQSLAPLPLFWFSVSKQ